MILRTKSEEISPTIEMTPIIDIVFLLLIFFLVATTYQQTEREMQIALPQTQSGGPITMSLRELVVNIEADGTIIVAGQTLSPANFRSLVTQAVEANPDQKVTIRGDRAASYASIAAALDICKSAGIQQPYLDTVPTP